MSNGGTFTLSNTGDTYSGQLTVQNGKLKIDTINGTSANGELGNNALSVILGNTGGQTGTLEYTGATASSSKKFTMAAGGTGAFQIDTAAAVLTLSGVIDGSTGALTKTGGSSTSVLLLSGANTFGGGLNVATGIVQLGATAGSGAATNVVSVGTGATFDLATFSPTVGGLSNISGSGGTVTNSSTAATLTITSTTTNTFGGVITATTPANLLLIKNGAGTQILTGADAYTGATTVNAGILQLSGASRCAGSFSHGYRIERRLLHRGQHGAQQ